jgi:hypothetical protein
MMMMMMMVMMMMMKFITGETNILCLSKFPGRIRVPFCQADIEQQNFVSIRKANRLD